MRMSANAAARVLTLVLYISEEQHLLVPANKDWARDACAGQAGQKYTSLGSVQACVLVRTPPG